MNLGLGKKKNRNQNQNVNHGNICSMFLMTDSPVGLYQTKVKSMCSFTNEMFDRVNSFLKQLREY